MKFMCYIVFSKSINRYYIGYTSDLENRLKEHLSGQFGTKSFTFKAKDWELFIAIPCENIEMAMRLEKLIKNKKSRKFIENLKRYPELLQKTIDDSNENPCAPSR